MLQDFYKRYERWWPILSFVLGFAYDIWSLDRIDAVSSVLKQGVYIGITGALLFWEVLAFHGKFAPQGKLAKVWSWQEFLIHFLFGSLLSEYTLFFFKSSSIFTSFVFLAFMAALILINEFKRFEGKSGIPVRSAIWGLCAAAYFIYLVPTLIGFVGYIPFILGLSLAGLVGWFLFKRLRLRMPEQELWLKKQVLSPFTGVLLAFLLLYVAHLIPPVPLSIQYIGVFHEIAKKDGKYLLGYNPAGRTWFGFGEPVFLVRPGDRPHCFARIFAPRNFKDEIFVRWYLKEAKRGWQPQDRIPLPISGGRDQGFRGYTVKSNFQPGEWQVRVETSDGREMGRTYFSIENDPSTEPRTLETEIQ